jgi:hypothetical protein
VYRLRFFTNEFVKIAVFRDVASCNLAIVSDVSEGPVAFIFMTDKSFYYDKNGGSRFLRVVGTYIPNYMALHPRRV